MINKKLLLPIVLLSILLSGCVTLLPTTVTRNAHDNLKNYKYFYVNPSGAKTGGAGYVTGGNYGLFGASETRSTEPCDIISGYLIKKGYIRVADIDENIRDKTLVVSYGETGRRAAGLGYTIEVTLQFTSSKTHEVVCTVTGEGQGETEADDIRIAINRCLNSVFDSSDN